jgi:hypothetical protein
VRNPLEVFNGKLYIVKRSLVAGSVRNPLEVFNGKLYIKYQLN